jgi:uncharacterized membrane protein
MITVIMRVASLVFAGIGLENVFDFGDDKQENSEIFSFSNLVPFFILGILSYIVYKLIKFPGNGRTRGKLL